MPIIATERSSAREYPLAPSGLHPGVCVDVVDLGIEQVTWQGKTKPVHKISFYFEIEPTYTYEDEEKGEVERRHMVFAKYTLSLSPMGNLRPDLESWLGRKLTPAEANGFDVESLRGEACTLQIMHNDSKTTGKTYANVVNIMPPQGDGIEPSGKYTPKSAREDGLDLEDDDDLPI